MATKIIAAQTRMFKNVFVCRDCNQKMRSDPLKVIAKTIRCRKCGRHTFRPIKSKKK